MEQQSLFKYFILTKITIFAIQFKTQFLIGHVQVVIHPCTNVIMYYYYYWYNIIIYHDIQFYLKNTNSFFRNEGL